MGKSKGGRKLYRPSCKSFPILSTLPTTFSPRDLARAWKKEACGLTETKQNKKNICVNQPVEGKKTSMEKMMLEGGDPDAKVERQLPDLAFWMTIEDIARWLPT